MVKETLVSCVMPTCDRGRFVPYAVEYFLRQDYPAKELIILDDGDEPVGRLLADDPTITYVRLDIRRTLGEKRNMGCRLARGELIAHWDDDDWMAPWRLSYQVEQIQESGADLCGLRSLLFHDVASGKTWRYHYPSGQRTWVAGGTFCYRKRVWQQKPFPKVNEGEDTRFVWGNRAINVLPLTEELFYVAMIHTRNTSPKHCRGTRWQHWSGDLAAILGDDLTRYELNGGNGRFKPDSAWPAKETTSNGGDPMKLNLGCCDTLLPGYINVDVHPAPGVTVADLREDWPWPDSSVNHIRAFDIIEHLPDKIFTMNEMWRVLRPGGQAEIAVPTTDGTGAWQDPTHVSFWNRRSFLYYEAGNPYRERFAEFYNISAKFRVVKEHIDRSLDGPRLTILLKAVKP